MSSKPQGRVQESSGDTQQPARSDTKRITAKALICSVVFIICYNILFVRGQMLHQGVILGAVLGVSQAGMAFAFLLIIINIVVGKFTKRAIFDQREIITVYIMVSMAAMLIHGGLWLLPAKIMSMPVQAVTNPGWNSIMARVSPLINPAANMTRSDIVTYVRGKAGAVVPWDAWIVPLLVWSVFFAAGFLAMTSLAVLVRRHWTELEHLTFPLAVPVTKMTQMASGTTSEGFWSNRVVQFGILVSIIFYSLPSLSRYFPIIPVIPGNVDFRKMVTTEPWASATYSTSIPMLNFEPLIYGIAGLLSLDMLFSLWSLTWFHYFRSVLFAAAGIRVIGVHGEATVPIAGFIGAGIFYIWLARHEIARMWRGAISGKGVEHDPMEQDEAMPYRLVFVGLIVGCVVMVLFLRYMLGVPLHFAVIYIFVFLMMTVGFARGRAHAGSPIVHSGSFWMSVTLTRIFGQSVLKYPETTGVVTVAYLEHSIDVGTFGAVTAVSLDSYKLGDDSGLNRRSVTRALWIAFLVGLISFVVIALPITYEKGASLVYGENTNVTGHTPEIFGYIQKNQVAQLYLWIWFTVTLLFTVLTGFMRMVFVWWPIHPAAVPLANNRFICAYYWFAFFVVWVFKFFGYRYGGAKFVNTIMRQFFLGLIAGSVVTQLFWFVLTGLINV